MEKIIQNTENYESIADGNFLVLPYKKYFDLFQKAVDVNNRKRSRKAMKNHPKAIIVKDDGHIDPNVWFGRYGIKYRISKKVRHHDEIGTTINVPVAEKKENLLKIVTSSEGIRRWHLGIQQSKIQGMKGWNTLELRLYVMKHGTVDGFLIKNFNNYDQIVEFYS